MLRYPLSYSYDLLAYQLFTFCHSSFIYSVSHTELVVCYHTFYNFLSGLPYSLFSIFTFFLILFFCISFFFISFFHLFIFIFHFFLFIFYLISISFSLPFPLQRLDCWVLLLVRRSCLQESSNSLRLSSLSHLIMYKVNTMEIDKVR